MNFLERRKIEKICKNLKYKYEFIKNSKSFIVYGKSDDNIDLQYISEWFISYMKDLGYYVSNVFYSNKLEVIFTKNR